MSTERIRGRRLQRIRNRLLEAEPLCRRCMAEDRVSAAVAIDHIIPLFKGGTETDGNRQPLCAACHETKTRQDMGHAPRPATGIDGWPA